MEQCRSFHYLYHSKLTNKEENLIFSGLISLVAFIIVTTPTGEVVFSLGQCGIYMS